MATCKFSTTIKDEQERGLKGIDFYVKVHDGSVGGVFIMPTEFTRRTDENGLVSFSVVQGASITVYGDHPSFANPQTVVVPSQSTYDLALLADLSAGAIGTTFTAGSLLFAGTGGIIAQDNANLFYGDATNTFALGTNAPVASAIFEMVSTSRGFLPPRMTTTQRDAITSPATGLTLYNTTTGALNTYNGTSWVAAGGSPAWGTITGTLSSQTDLQTALDARQLLDSDLTALAAFSATGFAARTGAGAWSPRTLQEGAGIDITNPAGVAGDPSIAFDATELNDLTWGDNTDASIAWTFNPTGSTNPVITATNNQFEVTTGNWLGPIWDKGGFVYNALAYCVADGTTDDSTALQNLISTTIPAAGARIVVPPGKTIAIGTTINIGNGTSSAVSTRHNVVIEGASGHLVNSPGALDPSGFKWIGASGGTMFNIDGPIGGIRFAHLLMNANSLANTVIDSIGAEGIKIEDVKVTSNRDFAFLIDHYASGHAVVTFDNSNAATLRNVYINSTVAGSKGVNVGATGAISQLTIDGARFTLQGGSNIGLRLGFTDSNNFRGLVSDIQIRPIASQPTFPSSIRIDNIHGTITIDNSLATWAPPTGRGISIGTFGTVDSETVPTDAINIRGITDAGLIFGTHQIRDTLSLGGAASATEMRFLELPANGSNYVGFKGPDLLTANLIYTLPSTAPTAGQILSAAAPVGDVSVLSWIAPSGSPSGSAGAVQLSNGAGAFTNDTDFSYDTTNNTLLVGGATALSAQDRLHTQVSIDPSHLWVMTTYATDAAPQIIFRTAGGSAGTPAAIGSGDFIGLISGRAHDGTAFTSTARAALTFKAAQDWTATNQGTFITLETTANNSTTRNERWRVEHGGWLIGKELTTDPTTAELAAGDQVARYVKNNKLVFAYNNAGVITYISIPLDGSTTTWTHNTTAP